MAIKSFIPFFLLLMFCGVAIEVSAQEISQYRSRILLAPENNIGRSSELSITELEQQIDTINEAYTRASATRHLARHYVAEKNYAAAIKWYQQALQADGLSDIANREILRELAQVQLLQGDYSGATKALQQALEINLVPESGDFLLLAQAYYYTGDYVAIVKVLDHMNDLHLVMDHNQMQQALALYYRAGAYEQCEQILHQLLRAEPDNADTWHQLAAVYLQQGKRHQAQDQLTLALEKQVPFTAEQMQQLLNILAANGNPYRAAEILENAISSNQAAADSSNYQKLFEFWLQARERTRSLQALSRAVALGGDMELSLYLAQLHIEDKQWSSAEQTILKACRRPLPDHYVSRANLLLGISLFKQQRNTAARQVLINATLVGGATAKAVQWLRYMQASPATDEELRRVRGPCYGSKGKQATLLEDKPSSPEPAQPSTAFSPGEGDIIQNTVSTLQLAEERPQSMFYLNLDESLTDFLPKAKSTAVRLNINLVKAGGSTNGPLQIILLPDKQPRLAQPVRGSPQARGRFKLYQSSSFKYAWLRLPVDTAAFSALPEQLRQFSKQVQSEGFELSGEKRLLLIQQEQPEIEIRLGIH
ncbi:MAG: tetratricopeptide repeat protein [Parahaliea sp.]